MLPVPGVESKALLLRAIRVERGVLAERLLLDDRARIGYVNLVPVVVAL